MNILLVDDDSDGRAYVGEFLRELGHHVVECRDGQDGLEAFGTGDYHMVLSDLKMPRLSGIELLHALSSFAGGRDFDVVLLTGHGGMDSAI
ncbi:MAG: response regulator, partial [Desulfotomaculaceae bacterium]|nr:response regulator [Desulfotomaculaceae bacterium]